MSEPTPDQARAFFRHLLDAFGATVVDKRSALEMQAVGGLLGQLGIVDRAAFLGHFATTVGRRIYVPFDVGVPSEGWSLWAQMMVCAHECQHVVQYDRLGAARFAWQYLGSTAARARLEAEAYRCQLELHFWRTGQLLAPHALASLLKSYGVTDADVQVAETILRLSGESVRRGAVINRASAVALDWLKANAPEIRAEA